MPFLSPPRVPRAPPSSSSSLWPSYWCIVNTGDISIKTSFIVLSRVLFLYSFVQDATDCGWACRISPYRAFLPPRKFIAVTAVFLFTYCMCVLLSYLLYYVCIAVLVVLCAYCCTCCTMCVLLYLLYYVCIAVLVVLCVYCCTCWTMCVMLELL